MNRVCLRGILIIFSLSVGLAAPGVAEPPLDRTVLPIPEPAPPAYTELDVRNATPPPRFEVNAPAGAPNVLIVLIDDLGFAGTSTFGGPVGTPTFDRMAEEGLYYNNFHTTAVCSPTRAAIKSGRNHHVNNMGGIIETGTAFPGNTGQIPNNVTPVAEMLRLNGYSTGAFGKWHETRCLGGQRLGSARPLADPPGLRQVLRLPRRGDQPVGAVYLRRNPSGRAAGRSELSLPDRHDRPGGRLDPVPEGADARQAVLRLLRAGRHPRAAPCSEGMDRALEGQVRPGLGRAARGDPGAPDRAGHRTQGHPACAQACSDPRLGRALGRREAPLHPPGRGVRRLRRDDRPRDRPGRPGHRGYRAARQHADLLRLRATTAPAQRAAATACSAR